MSLTINELKAFTDLEARVTALEQRFAALESVHERDLEIEGNQTHYAERLRKNPSEMRAAELFRMDSQ